MKDKTIIAFITIILLLGGNACHSPEEPASVGEREGIISVTASFPYENSTENSFNGEIDHENQLITIVFPYNYPKLSDNVLPYEALEKVKITANVDNNIKITPPMGYFDLTKDCFITVVDQIKGIEKTYKIVAEIRKNNECTINHFSIPAKNITGVIDEKNYTISLVTVENIGLQIAEVSLPHGATCEPDILTLPLSYDEEQTVKVTAQNGKDYLIYTIKKAIPAKLSSGIRPNSGKLLWAKKLSEVGITSINKTTSLGVVDGFVVINERGSSDAIYLNSQTGEPVGKMNVSNAATGDFSNYFMTADRANNILICNYTPNGTNLFTVWKAKGIDGQLEKYIEYEAVKEGIERFGWALSVQGDLDKDALITTCVFYKDGNKAQFARWQVVNGVLQSQTPDFVELTSLVANTGGTNTWMKAADVVCTSSSNLQSDYFLASYARFDLPAPDNLRYFLWYNGTTNSVKDKVNISSIANAPLTAVDYVKFNNSSYVAHTIVEPFGGIISKTVDVVYMYDVTLGSFAAPIKVCEPGIYGSFAGSGVKNSEWASDVVFRVSPDGYYLYVYFMFANGYVACQQYDCIDM